MRVELFERVPPESTRVRVATQRAQIESDIPVGMSVHIVKKLRTCNNKYTFFHMYVHMYLGLKGVAGSLLKRPWKMLLRSGKPN